MFFFGFKVQYLYHRILPVHLQVQLLIKPILSAFFNFKVGLSIGIPASVSHSGNGEFRYRTGSPYSGAGQVPASAYLFIPVPGIQDADQAYIPAFKNTSQRGKKIHTPCTSTSVSVGQGYILYVHPARPYCWWWKGTHPGRPYCWW